MELKYIAALAKGALKGLLLKQYSIHPHEALYQSLTVADEWLDFFLHFFFHWNAGSAQYEGVVSDGPPEAWRHQVAAWLH